MTLSSFLPVLHRLRRTPRPKLRIGGRSAIAAVGACAATGAALIAYSIAQDPAEAPRKTPLGLAVAHARLTESLTTGPQSQIMTWNPASLPAQAAATPTPEAPAASRPSSPTESLIDSPEIARVFPDLPSAEPAAQEGEWQQTAPTAPQPVHRQVSVGRGDTLMRILVRAGIDRREGHGAVAAMRKVFDPRRLRPGQQLTLEFLPDENGEERFVGIALDIDIEHSIAVAREGDDAFAARKIQRSLIRDLAHGAGRIDSSLYVAGMQQSVPASVMIDLIHIFSFDVDFQRDIRSGDSFEVMFERFRDEDRRAARDGEIIYASLTLSGVRYRLWRHKTADGRIDYYDEKGQSMRKALMRTPIDGARISSRFGRRRHPVLGYNKMHRGTDFAAPRGTPIYAAGDGVVEKAGRKGGYGNYIRLRHNSSYKTAYAHLTRFARGVRAGKRVRQGQTIGYVGSTGRSTGPHLHYEVIREGRKINSQNMRLPSGRKLKGQDLETYQAARSQLAEQFAAVATGREITSASADEAPPVAKDN